ncbi:MAG: phage tail protein [Anaerolineae bacterium]
MDGTLSEIKIWAANFAPRGWMFCHGQVLSVAQFSGLYSILGTVYGGDSATTFRLPDLRGRVPVGAGIGDELREIQLGAAFGTEAVSLDGVEAKSHSHSKATDVSESTTNVASGGNEYGNHQPSIGLNYIICVNGLFPARN